ncbi:MAG: pyridoxamine 5'-phosphate oxidase [Bacteroidetes bacterium]|nr:pyridoxamine 5'-phosphate oxidase [Bacteroidota bacterium]
MKHLNEYLQGSRIQYDKGILSENHLLENPLDQFEAWMKEAIAAGVFEPNAVDLSTVNDGRPSSRIVLLKGVDKRGFVFYTNYDSRKGKEMAESPFVSLNFFWTLQARQVRIEGRIEKVSPEESDAYFASRPRDSQIGAWASAQSTVIKSREIIESNIAQLEKQYEGKDIPRPAHWGGYIVLPDRIEFWQGRPNRLHDRFLYEDSPTGWMVFRLAP